MLREIARRLADKTTGAARAACAPDVALHSGRAAARRAAPIAEEDQRRGDDLVGHPRSGRVRAKRLFATGVSNVPHDPGEHKQRGCPRQQGSDDHRCYRCHDSSLTRPARSIGNSSPGGSSHIAGLSLLGDRRLRTFVEPPPIGLVALPLTFVGLTAPGRAKLLEVQAEADQPERTVAIWIPATICHDATSALVRRIQRMNCS